MILLIGLLLLVIAIPVPGESDKEQEETKRETSVGIRSGNGTGAEDTLVGQYEAYLEKRVADALECVEGVAVIAEGGDHPVVVQNITEAIQALFGIEAHKIKIMKRTTAGS